MAKYIDILLTLDGTFCIAPAWTVSEGDYITVENVLTGATELKEVTAIATDTMDGDFFKLVKTYIGYQPYMVTKKYREITVPWEGEKNVSE